MSRIVALLDSMWGWGGFNDPGEVAPRYFRINPANHSGGRLYRLVGSHDLLVTNCVRFVQSHANQHGTPDPQWVEENITMLSKGDMDLLLVCGAVAQATFQIAMPNYSIALKTFKLNGRSRSIPYLKIDHPAARRWSNEKLNATAQEIEELCRA